MEIGFIVKSDRYFYEGLAALLSSLNQWYPDIPTLTIDCGLTPEQLDRVWSSGLTKIILPSLETFSVASEMSHYYTPAIYGLIACRDQLFSHSIHIDADAVVLGPLDDLMQQPTPGLPGISAVPDYPHLNLEFQIGNKPGIYERVAAVIPNVNLQSLTFNGGVFALQRDYFNSLMKEPIERLMDLHDKLWGNEMAMMNLAAFAAKPDFPFRILDQSYNTRPRYRRAPDLPSNRLTAGSCGQINGVEPPKLLGPFGVVKILHFVGHTKPWHANANKDDSLLAWEFYRQRAKDKHGL